jgi:adenosylcobinamide kinase/adenosylcobinamide-phosphate guanylyltransferase
MLVSNVLGWVDDPRDADRAQRLVQAEIGAMLEAAGTVEATVIIVSNEVGGGVVPATPLGRQFRDLLGRANQVLAERAGNVYLLVAGIAVELKDLQSELQRKIASKQKTGQV